MMIYMDNRSEYIHAWFGATRAGVVEVPINTGYFGDFLKHALNVTTPRGVVVGSNYVSRFVDIAASVKNLELCFFVVGDSAADGVRALQEAGYEAELYDGLAKSEPATQLPVQARWDLGAIIFTSGTTGPSKGVMIPNAQCYFASEQCVSQVRLTVDDVYMTGNPLFHFNAQFLTTYPTLIAGGRMVLYEKFSPTRFSQRVAESGATVTNFVGVMMDWVAKQPAAETDKQSRLRCIFSAPTAWDLVPEIRKRFGVKAFAEGFGHTETGQPIIAPYGVDRPPGAAGLALSESSWRIRKPTNRSPKGRLENCNSAPANLGYLTRVTSTCPRPRPQRAGISGFTPATGCGRTRTAGSISSTASRTACGVAAKTSRHSKSSNPS
jgi:crotonobetaine/carnitine-CoA ligase